MKERFKHGEPARTGGHPPAIAGNLAFTPPIKRGQQYAAPCLAGTTAAATAPAGTGWSDPQ